jgi:type II secretory pathway pseudopilin PulG
VLSPSRLRGFTLVELMLSIGMTSIVGAAVYQLLVTTERLSRFQAEQVARQASLRAGSLVVTNELRELAPEDLLGLDAHSLTYRAMRGMGFLCQVGTPTQLRIARSEFSGFRDPQSGRDSLYLFLEGAAETVLDDAWLPLPIIQVSDATCPGAGNAGLVLTVPSRAALAWADPGTPIRVFEVMELRLYRSEGSSWLGTRSVTAGEAIQPMVGPLTDGDGFRLDYLDGENRPVGNAAAVKSVRVTLRAIGGSGSTPVAQELTGQVALRNAALP